MRTISGLAAAAALVVVATGAPAGAAPSSLENEGTTYDVVGVITDADGTTHTRLVSRYDGLPVIGGDRVVHRGPAGSARSISQTLAAPLSLVTTPVVGVC